jgi:hypothetical protein
MIIKVAGLVSTIAILAAISMPSAFAQTANSTSGATSSSGAASSSRSGAISTSRGGAGGTGGAATATQGVSSSTQTGVTLNQTSNASPNTSANNTDRLTGGTSNTNQNSNSGYTSSDNIVRTTPTVYAPPVSGGNPCTLAVSGGVSVIGWGAAAGGTFVDEDCANRQKIAMVHNAGYQKIAFELMCNDRNTYNAAKSAGQPCAYRPQFEAPGAPAQPVPPMVQQQPVPIGPPPVVRTSTVVKDQTNLPRCSRTITDNCYGG